MKDLPRNELNWKVFGGRFFFPNKARARNLEAISKKQLSPRIRQKAPLIASEKCHAGALA
jgi:hypothetical protein